jgi:hypothetical protein
MQVSQAIHNGAVYIISLIDHLTQLLICLTCTLLFCKDHSSCNVRPYFPILHTSRSKFLSNATDRMISSVPAHTSRVYIRWFQARPYGGSVMLVYFYPENIVMQHSIIRCYASSTGATIEFMLFGGKILGFKYKRTYVITDQVH